MGSTNENPARGEAAGFGNVDCCQAINTRLPTVSADILQAGIFTVRDAAEIVRERQVLERGSA